MSAIQRARRAKGFVYSERTCIGCSQAYMPTNGHQVWCSVACRREHNRARMYGMTQAELKALFGKQGNRCAICQAEGKKLNVDHNHVTGRVRGLLCQVCNTGLGKFGDSQERLMDAIRYLSESTP